MFKNLQFVCFLTLLIFLPLHKITAQESILQSYQYNFIRASLSQKTEILRDAATDEKAGEFIGQLSDLALRFALQNAELLKDDDGMTGLIREAAALIKNSGYRAGADTLWDVFASYSESHTRQEILDALSVLGKGNSQIALNIGQYLDGQNKLQRSGLRPDYTVVSACIAVLAALGDNSSFAVLFQAALSAYPPDISSSACSALEQIPGNYQQFLLDVIQNNPPSEKLAALKAGSESARLNPANLGQLAEEAMEQSLANIPGSVDDVSLSALRYHAALVLTRLHWSRASALAVKHFYRTQAGYQDGNAPKERLIEAIACLGAVGNSDAATALALQLGLLNAQTEKNGTSDDDIVLAVVQALGNIGDKSAFDYLLYISYLPYPEDIQAAARDALSRLKW